MINVSPKVVLELEYWILDGNGLEPEPLLNEIQSMDGIRSIACIILPT